ncbi:MAG: hypothetical protein PHE20_02715 [Patescibacteria group bacterium]|nr:hypothetical protein [Patescibacteria group bacterium]
MPSRNRSADTERIRQKHQKEAAQKAPMAIILNLKSDEDDKIYYAKQIFINVFGRILIFSYSLPLNGKSGEFERMTKQADYLLILGDPSSATPEINEKFDIIFKANYEIKIINQSGFNFPALNGRKTTEIKKLTKTAIEKIIS